MSYVESFETEMSRARIRMADYNSPYLDHLQAAHDAEMKQLSKEEFHRGYRSGIDARDAKQWQLDRKRHKVVCRLRGFEPRNGGKPTEEASKLIRCIIGREDCHVACVNDLEEARDRLIYLLGGKSINKGAETSAKVVQNGEKYQLATDVLGNERHKVVCELRKMRLDTGTAIKKLAIALGIRWNAANTPKSCALIQSRLIHLLGGDNETASNEDGSEYGLSDRIDGSGSCMGDSMGGSEHCEDTCDCGCERLTALDNGTCPNDDVTCPNNGPTSSITDELREFVAEIWDGSIYVYQVPIRLLEIADRIDEQFNRICSQHESVLQQTISDTVDEHEREMAELRAELEDAQALIADNANDWTAYRMAQRERDSLLDLLRDAREEYKMLDRMLVETSANFHAMRDRVWGLEAERDELKANLDESVTNQVELEEDFNSVRRQWDECEEWCNELLDKLAEYESCGLAQTHRTLRRMLGEVKNLHDTLKAKVDAKPRVAEERDKYRKLAKRNEQWCDALLDLIRDAATDYEAEHMECVELSQKLSARDAVIDNYHERMKGLDEAERRMAVAESKCEELRKMLITQDYVRGVIDQEEARRRIERLKNAGS